MSYPTGTDLLEYMTDAGYALTRPLSLSAKIKAAIAEWDRGTGYTPFVSDGSVTTRYYDPGGANRGGIGLSAIGGGRFLDLEAGLISLTSLTVTGSVYTHGVQFYLEDVNAPAKGRPYEMIRFVVPVWGNRQCIAVTGVFGFCLKLPDDAWEAILQRGMALCAPQLSLKKTGGVVSRKQGDEEIRYSDKGVGVGETSSWNDYFRDRMAFYKLTTFG
jgi:hypothetical protein